MSNGSEPINILGDTLPSQQDWKRIKKYTNSHLKRHAKLLHLSIIDKSTICFGAYEIPKLNFN